MVNLVETVHHLRRVVPISEWTPVLGLAAVVLSLLIWRRLARRLGWRPLPTLLALLWLAGALAVTLSPRDWLANHRSLAECLPSDWAQVGDSMTRVGHNLESLLNVGLLLPLGFALVVAGRRIVWPALLVALLPAAIEITQVVVPGRECSPSDYFANALGGLIGVALGVPVNRWWRARELAQPAVQPTATVSGR
jgi:VanZ family protein